MERVMSKKIKSRFAIHIEDVLCASIAAILGSVISPYGYILTFLYVSYSYLRNQRESVIVVFFVLISALSRGVLPAYLYALGFASFLVIVHILKLLNRNLYEWMPYITTVVVIPFSIQGFGMDRKAIILVVLAFTIMQLVCEEYSWIRKSYVLAESMYGIVIFSIYLLLAELLPAYQEIILIAMFIGITFICSKETTCILAISSYFLIPIKDPSWLLFLCAIAVFRENKKVTFLLLLGSVFWLGQTIPEYIFIAICTCALFVSNRKKIPILANTPQQLENRLPENGILKRQMQNYASIFQSLSQYYAQVNDVQSEILSNMSTALQYNADVIRKIDGLDNDKLRLQRAMEGYQYDVASFLMEEPKEGHIHIELDIRNIKRNEIRTTLLPLLEVLLHRNLEVESIHNRRFSSGYHRIVITDSIPFEIESYAESVKNSYTSSGDTFSIFRFRQSVVCMISDGMGNGDKAAESSRIITNIFQRMMVSGIPQDSAIRCINKLIQSDTYATLDVVCFNNSQGVAYISKSAACPTLLLRGKEVFEISGNSLPVGIISQMQPDCFQIELQKDDEYLLISDGIEMSEVNEWLALRKYESVRKDVDLFKEILKKTRRKDDSTIVLARIIDKH